MPKDRAPARRDHVDDFLDTLDVPGLDPVVEGIVDRIQGLHRRFRRSLEDTITDSRAACSSAFRIRTTGAAWSWS